MWGSPKLATHRHSDLVLALCRRWVRRGLLLRPSASREHESRNTFRRSAAKSIQSTGRFAQFNAHCNNRKGNVLPNQWPTCDLRASQSPSAISAGLPTPTQPQAPHDTTLLQRGFVGQGELKAMPKLSINSHTHRGVSGSMRPRGGFAKRRLGHDQLENPGTDYARAFQAVCQARLDPSAQPSPNSIRLQRRLSQARGNRSGVKLLEGGSSGLSIFNAKRVPRF